MNSRLLPLDKYDIQEYAIKGERKQDLKAPLIVDDGSRELVASLNMGDLISIDGFGLFEVSWISEYDIFQGTKKTLKVNVYVNLVRKEIKV